MKGYGVLLACDYTRIESVEMSGNLLIGLKKMIGCKWIETVPVFDGKYQMIIDEEGKLTGKPFNLFGSYLYGTLQHGDPIVGNAVIVKVVDGDEGADLAWLSEDEADVIKSCLVGNWHQIVREMTAWAYEEG